MKPSKTITNMYKSLNEFFHKMEMEPDPELWKNLVREEKLELLKEAVDHLYVLVGLSSCYSSEGKVDGFLESNKSVEIYCYKYIDIFGLEVLEEAFRRVHESNMSKLGDDGKPIRREDGKIIKGPNYKPPNLEDLIK